MIAGTVDRTVEVGETDYHTAEVAEADGTTDYTAEEGDTVGFDNKLKLEDACGRMAGSGNHCDSKNQNAQGLHLH